MMAATLLCRSSHLRFPSWTISFSLLAASVRFSRASRRYCLFTSSSWVRRSWTCRWNAYESHRICDTPGTTSPFLVSVPVKPVSG